MALKVFSGLTMKGGKQVKTIVAASSKKKAAELVGVSLGHLSAYWSVTGNEIAVKTAIAQPETVFKAKDIHGLDFSPASADD